MGLAWERVKASGVVAGPNPRCAEPPPAGLLEGVRLFNAGQFYECHHSLEAIWLEERDPIRYLYQGVLQVGVGFHHLRRGNWRGAVKLLRDGIDKVECFLPTCMSLDTARLAREASICLIELHTLGQEQVQAFDWTLLPQVHLLPETDTTCRTESAHIDLSPADTSRLPAEPR